MTLLGKDFKPSPFSSRMDMVSTGKVVVSWMGIIKCMGTHIYIYMHKQNRDLLYSSFQTRKESRKDPLPL